MLWHRRILLLLAVLIGPGSISATVAYALHLRSDAYLRNLQDRLSDRLGMTVRIGQARPLSFRSRRLSDVSLWHPIRKVEVFHCNRALWEQLPADGPRGFSLTLQNGWLLTGTPDWARTDYELLLRTGFAHDFRRLRLKEVLLDGIDLRWQHPTMTFTADRSTGRIDLEPDGDSRATLTTTRLNGFDVGEPVQIAAKFTPGPRLKFNRVDLSVPDIPLSGLALDAVLKRPVTHGHFSGQVTYRHTADRFSVTLSGAVRDAVLSELTAGIPQGPFNGNLDLVIDEATVADGALRTLRFSGRVSDLSVAQIADAAGIHGLSGTVDLRIHGAAVTAGSIAYLSAEGHASGIPIDSLGELIGFAGVNGTLSADIRSLIVVDDRLAVADVVFDAVPPEGAPGRIDRAALKRVSEQIWDFDATRLLPPGIDSIEYTRLGARLALNGNELHIYGTHGKNNETILTIKLFGREIGAVKQPDRTYMIEDPIAQLRTHFQQDHADPTTN